MFTPAVIASLGALVLVTQIVPALWSDTPDTPARRVRNSSPSGLAQNAAPAPPAATRTAERKGDEALVTGSLTPDRPRTNIDSALAARVVIRAEQTAAISAELNARITRMPFKVGDRFRTGAVLIEFDCQRIKAELAAASAAHKLQRNAVETVSQLHKLGSAGLYNLRQAQFEMEKAAAEVENLKAKQATCIIRAPFDGSIAERLAAPHEVVNPNQPLLRIVDAGEPELQLIVPSGWLSWLKPGVGFDVAVDETGRSYRAVLNNVAGAVDPVSQTVRLVGKLEGKHADVVPGMSGTARFKPTQGAKP